MIVFSCNVFSDDEIRAAVGDPDGPGTVSQVYRHLGSGAHCGRCTRTVAEVLRQQRADSEEGSPWACGAAVNSASRNSTP